MQFILKKNIFFFSWLIVLTFFAANLFFFCMVPVTLERSISVFMLNEMSDADTIYDFSQTGPQEEPHTQEYKIDLNKFYNYKKSKYHSNLNKRNLFK